MRKYCQDNVIVFGAPDNNLLGQIRSFGEAGIRSYVICVGHKSKYNILKSKYILESHIVPSIDEGLLFIKRHYIDDNKKGFVSTNSDAIVMKMDEEYDFFSKYFYFFNAQGKMRISMPKEEQYKLASKCGFNVPKSEIVKIGDMPTMIEFPIFTKPVDCFDWKNWKNCECLCKNENELLTFYKTINLKEIIIQEYISKDNECLLEGISINHGENVEIFVEGGYIGLPDDNYGSKAYYTNNDKEKNAELIKPVRQMLKEIGYEGIFEVELLQAKGSGKLYFLEINFRHTLFNYAITRMGYNLSNIWLESNKSRTLNKAIEHGNQRRHILLNESSDFKRMVMGKQMSFVKWLIQLLRIDSFLLWNRKDIGPVIWRYLYALNDKMFNG